MSSKLVYIVSFAVFTAGPSAHADTQEIFQESKFGSAPSDPSNPYRSLASSGQDQPYAADSGRGIASVTDTTSNDAPSQQKVFESVPVRNGMEVRELRRQVDSIQDQRTPNQVQSENIRGPSSVGAVVNPTDAVVLDAPKTSLVSDSQKGVQEVSLFATPRGYFPSTLFVTKGVPVRIFLGAVGTKKPLCFVADGFGLFKEVTTRSVEEIVFTPQAAGQFPFHCPINSSEGLIVVREAP